MDKISVIIPSFQSSNYIIETLKALDQQTVLPDEVIIVDEDLDKSLSEILNKLEFKVNINHIKYSGKSFPPNKRNHGVLNAKNEILAWSGGTFYSRETPDAEEYVMEGQHVEKGDVIGLLEVMKMFNQIRAEFAGTIRKICVTPGSGIIVSRGQQLFEIEPDDPSESETKEEKLMKQQEYTVKLMKRIVPLN